MFDDYDDEESDEFSEPIEPMTRWSLLLCLVIGGYWGAFYMARGSGQYDLALQMLRIGYAITPIIAGLAFIAAMVALRRLHKKGFAQRGLAVIAIAVSTVTLLAWIFFTIYINALRR